MSSLKFGTSGLRGLAVELADAPAADYTGAFLAHLAAIGEFKSGDTVAIAMDLRFTSPDIAGWCAGAIEGMGGKVLNLGAVPTPALALRCMRDAIAGVMVTGSHIPDDRNGLKFYRASGEIEKSDEAAINACHGAGKGSGHGPVMLPETDPSGRADYLSRYARAFAGTLDGLTVGVFEHSSVGRDIFCEALEAAGARTVRLGRSETFIPVDTEALRPEDIKSLAEWAQDNRLDAIISSDGDADRPLVADENGRFVPGDTVGALTARFLGASVIATPVTSNSALEARLPGMHVVRTRVGSPYVIEAMQQARTGLGPVVGFEANGGVLLGGDVALNGTVLGGLPTRDSLLPILCVLAATNRSGMPLSALVRDLNLNAKHSDRVTDYARETSEGFIASLSQSDAAMAPVWESLESSDPAAHSVDRTDGVKFIAGVKSLHFRPSGNAPELRIYCEAPDAGTATDIVNRWIARARDFAKG